MIEPFLSDKKGLEIGGPSPIFRSGRLIPVYDRCRQVDNCDFAVRTLWSEQARRSGFGKRLGKQFVSEACELSAVSDQAYDFVLASHVLEHCANPLRTLLEWKRVLVPGGAVLLIVPDRRTTFDHRRPITPLEHIEADFRANVSENDLTHLDEILALHDLSLDLPAGTRTEFRNRCLNNGRIRAMHHHVFSPETLTGLFTLAALRMTVLIIEAPFHIIALGESPDSARAVSVPEHNAAFLGESAEWRKYDPV